MIGGRRELTVLLTFYDCIIFVQHIYLMCVWYLVQKPENFLYSLYCIVITQSIIEYKSDIARTLVLQNQNKKFKNLSSLQFIETATPPTFYRRRAAFIIKMTLLKRAVLNKESS